MKKNTYFAIVAAVIVVAIIAVVFLVKGNNGSKGGKTDKDNTSSVASVSNVSSVNNEKAIEEGKMGLGASSAEEDGVYTVPINIDENPGICAYQLEVSYNEGFEFAGIDNGLLSPMETDAKSGVLGIVGVEDKDITENGTLFTLKFKAGKKIKSGEYPLKITKLEVCNYDEIWVKPTIADGKIVVK